MAADFNAGSIEGTLDLDTRPFAAGLRKAQMQADSFEHRKIKATASLDTSELSAKEDVAKAKLDELGHKKVSAKADLDISEAEAKAALLNRTLSKALDAGGLGHATINPAMFIGKFVAIAGGLMSIAAAAGPATAAVVGFGAAAGAAFAGAGISLGLFAKMVEGDFATIQKAVKAHKQLAGAAGTAETAFKHLSAAWAHLQKSIGGGGYKFLTVAFNGLAAILPKIEPLMRTVTNGMDNLIKKVMSISKTPIFAAFLKSLQGFMHGFIAGAGPVILNLLAAFMHAFIVLRPLMSELGRGLSELVAKATGFAAGGGLQTFVGYVQKVAPEMLHLLTNVANALGHLGRGIAPLAQPAIHFISSLVHAIGTLNLAPLAHGFGQLLDALRPILPVAAGLINVALKPIGALLGALAHGPVAAIAASLGKRLAPAFGALKGTLMALVHPIAQFLASIANLANPTGIRVFTTLLKGLEGVVKTVAPPLGKLAVALENVVDTGLNAILPVLPKLKPLLDAAAGAVAFLANGLAKVLAVKGVALTLLGIVGALKAFSVIHSVVSSVSYFVGAMKTLMSIAKADGALAALGSVFPKLAAGLAAVKDMAIGTRIQLAALWVQERLVAVWGRIVAAAEKAWTVIQGALDAVLDANPIGIVVLAIAGLVVALVEAWKHSKTFRDIVEAALHGVADAARVVFDWLKNAVSDVINFIRGHWQLLVGIMLGPLGIVVALVISHWSQIRSFISNALSDIVHFVSSALSNVVGFFASLPGRIGAFVSGMVGAGEHLMSGVWDGLKNVWGSIWSWISGLPGQIVGAFSGIGGRVVGSITSSIHSAVGAVGGAVGSALRHIGLATGGVTNGITSAVIGDNPGGQEAVIPLDKYDLPRKGDAAREHAMVEAAAQARQAQQLSRLDEVTGLLKQLVNKPHPEFTNLSDGSLKKLQQMIRAAS